MTAALRFLLVVARPDRGAVLAFSGAPMLFDGAPLAFQTS